jgi:multiple sugar transport system substrate-binding protein
VVFQGGDYEGGVVNALEFIWGARGRLMIANLTFVPSFGVTPADVIDPNVITVDSPEAAQGLNVARSLIAEGVAPEAVTTFRELEATQTFLAGDAVFMRNWPYVYGSLTDPEQSAITADQVGVAPIPVSTSPRSYSCLGGWNLMINASSRKQDAAWEFIRFATDPAQQKMRALEGGFLPTLNSLYDDPEIQQAMPVVVLGREALTNVRARPSSPFYSQMSPRISGVFNRVLRGELTGEEAVQKLAGELRTILRKNR